MLVLLDVCESSKLLLLSTNSTAIIMNWPSCTSCTECKAQPSEAGQCNKMTNHLFSWPSNPVVALAWAEFVNQKRADFIQPDRTSKLCYRHFKGWLAWGCKEAM